MVVEPASNVVIELTMNVVVEPSRGNALHHVFHHNYLYQYRVFSPEAQKCVRSLKKTDCFTRLREIGIRLVKIHFVQDLDSAVLQVKYNSQPAI